MDVTGNMNPFLFDDPAPSTGEDNEMSNPFLNGGGFDFSASSYSGVNPFSDQIDETTTAGMNVFGSQPAYASENPFDAIPATPSLFDPNNEQVTASVDFFSSVPHGENVPVDLFGVPASQPSKPPPPRPPSPSRMSDANNVSTKPPPPRPPPPSKETKDLLQTVIGAMEATTDTIQDKLNTTVTPCPSPGGGMHSSRSPTPDIHVTAPEKESEDAFSTIFGQTIELSDVEGDDQPGADVQTTTEPTAEFSAFAPSEPATAPTAAPSDDIDLFFGEAVPQSKPKTTQDILSLFNKPSESTKQVDLLSDDLISGDAAPNLQEAQDKGEVSNSSAVDLLSSGIDSLSEGEMTKDISSDLSNQFGGSEAQEGSETVIAPDQVSERRTSGADMMQTTLAQQEMDRRLSISSEDMESKIEFPKSPASSPEVGASPSEKTKDVSVGQTAVEEESTSNMVPKPESDNSLENKKMDPAVTEMFGVPEAISDQVVNQELSSQEPVPEAPQTTPFDSFFNAEPPTASVESFVSAEPQPASVDSFVNAEPQPAPFDSFVNTEPQPAPFDSFVNTETQPAPFDSFVNTETQPAPFDSFVNTETQPAPFDSFVNAEPQIAPIDTSVLDNAFGSKSELEPLSPAPFFNIPENVAPHPTPSSITSTGFDLFSESEIAPTSPSAVPTSVAETTGATLFETETPAPNVGMSLFGAGEEASLDIFAESAGNTIINPFAPAPTAPTSVATLASVSSSKVNEATEEEFDAFSARFESVTTTDTAEVAFDPFTAGNRAPSPWGQQSTGAAAENFGFGDDAKFDPFLALNEPPPPPQSTPRKIKRDDSRDSDETPMNVIIRPAALEGGTPVPLAPSPVPVLAPPPAALSTAFTDSTPRFNPFDKSGEEPSEAVPPGVTAFPGPRGELQRSESQETPPTPLFEEDQSVPLEPYPRTLYDGRVWEMHLRQPNKKKITGQRFWKKVFVKLTDAGALQLYNSTEDKEPFQELPLQPCYSVSDIGAQQFDQFGKIFTVKVQYIFYKERPGVRPGQISKAERITNKLSKFAQYAIAGDYEGVKEFASDVRKLGMPVEHAPQISQLLKLGTQNYEELKVFASLIEEFMFKLTVHRDRALTYKSEEVQLTAVDEMYIEQDLRGAVTHMVARVRIFFLGFLTGMPEVDLGINDLRKQGHEVVGRHDIIPVITEEWIRLEDIEFHCTVNQEEFEMTRHIKFKPPDACYIELMRFRVRPPKNRELPLQVKTKFFIQGKRVEIQSEILVPGFSGRKLGQVPCEDVAVRFPLPECWIYMFRVEKHFRYGSVKSAHRRTGKVKGIERLKGTMENAESTLMEVTSGQAKYEHQHRAIVWRMSRLPKEGQGAYSVHQFTCKMCLTDYDQIPPTLDRFCMLEFTMPATTVSHCVMRSVSVTSDDPPEKYVRYLARHEYKIEIEFTSESAQNEYLAATALKAQQQKEEEKEAHPAPVQEESSSDEST